MKKYQGGGMAAATGYTHYGGNPYAQEDPMQYLMQQFGGLGYDFNPQGDLLSQLQAVTPESLMQNVRSTYNIGSKVDMAPGMFQGFSPEELQSLTPGFYDPIFEEGRETALQTLTSNMGKIGKHGFAGTGSDIRKTDLAQDIYKRSMDKAWLGVEEQQATKQKYI